MICKYFWILFFLFCGAQLKELRCTTSGHLCIAENQTNMNPCATKAAHDFQCFQNEFISGICDYCPETHLPPTQGPSNKEGLFPCRKEDGYHLCHGNKSDNCVRRSTLNSLLHLTQPCKLIDEKIEFVDINCTDDEITCRTHKRCINRYELGTEFGCEFDAVNVFIKCHQDEFQCKISKRCIPRRWVRDGNADCLLSKKPLNDTSDEDEPLESCDSTTEFRCHDKTLRCIPRDMVMNGMKDCLNGSDEDQALDCNDQNEFRCSVNGRCIPRYRVNDGFADCINATDENLPHFGCNLHKEFECVGEHRCIPRSWVGNSLFDCKSGIDEEEQLRNCTEDEFACEDGSRCLPRKYLCDGVKNCADCSDEIELCDEPRRFRCSNDTSVCIPWAYTCDGPKDCTDGSDERTNELSGFKCSSDHFNQCYRPQFMLQDNNHYLKSCPDHSDWCFEGDQLVNCSRCLDKSRIISKSQICDGLVDCPDLSDECTCAEATNVEPLCVLLLSMDQKLHQLFPLVCDGKSDLKDGLDEEFCFQKTESIINTETCKSQHSDFNLSLKIGARQMTRCDHVIDCPLREDECESNCTGNEDLCFNFSKIYCWIDGMYQSVRQAHVCDGIVHCEDGSDESNCSSNPESCFGRKLHYDQFSLKKVRIENPAQCDFVTDCNDSSDELNCNETHFYCQGGTPLYIRKDKVLDFTVDCDDASDECSVQIKRFQNRAFASETELLNSKFFRIFIWITGGISIIGNICVFIITVKKLFKLKEKNSIPYCNRLLILHLSIADLLMGVSLYILAFKSLNYSGNYCRNDITWRGSLTCNLIGFFTVLSSQASLNILIVLTGARLMVVVKSCHSGVIKMRVCWLLILVSWGLAFIFAVVPLLHNSLSTNQIFLRSNPFFNKTSLVTEQQMIRYMTRTNQFGNISEEKTFLSNWYFLTDQSKSLFPFRSVSIISYLGYYSNNSVCLPDYYTSAAPKKYFSFTVIMYNICSILFITISYYTINQRSLPYKTGSLRRRFSDTLNREKATLRRRAAFLVSTNVFCWLPICLCSLLTYGGLELPMEMYAVTQIILLPINSCLNPIFYSMLPQRLVGSVLNYFKCNDKKENPSNSPTLTIKEAYFSTTVFNMK